MKRRVYADNAATTRLCDEAYDKMLPLLREHYYNPSGKYTLSVETRSYINEARRIISKSLGTFDKEIIFTAGGSEADTMALKGVMRANREKGRHLVVSNIEHHAVLECAHALEREGFRVTFVKAKENGLVDVKDVENAICADTVLVSVMFANNELGTLEPIREIGELTKSKGVLLHTDAVQAYGKLDIKPSELNIDLLSASAHKFNGPKGAGFLYVRNGVKISPVINGGSQERSLRGGTENVAAIAGMGAAALVSLSKMEERYLYEKTLKEHLYSRISDEIENVELNGDYENALPGILNLSFEGVEGESLVIMMDMKGVMLATGSACAESFEEPSHVITGIGKSMDKARSSIRFSLSHENTMEEVDYIVDSLKESVEYLRKMRMM